jgi:hypothetical protein
MGRPVAGLWRPRVALVAADTPSMILSEGIFWAFDVNSRNEVDPIVKTRFWMLVDDSCRMRQAIFL